MSAISLDLRMASYPAVGDGSLKPESSLQFAAVGGEGPKIDPKLGSVSGSDARTLGSPLGGGSMTAGTTLLESNSSSQVVMRPPR
jgi:hypothetical protein